MSRENDFTILFMKKLISIVAVLVTICFYIPTVVGTPDNRIMTDWTQTSANFENMVSDLGPSVARGITAFCSMYGGGSKTISIDVYPAPNSCNQYMAYLAGTATDPMLVCNNPDYTGRSGSNSTYYKYYVIYKGSKYYFSL